MGGSAVQQVGTVQCREKEKGDSPEIRESPALLSCGANPFSASLMKRWREPLKNLGPRLSIRPAVKGLAGRKTNIVSICFG